MGRLRQFLAAPALRRNLRKNINIGVDVWNSDQVPEVRKKLHVSEPAWRIGALRNPVNRQNRLDVETAGRRQLKR